jgi:uncharacterized repeat protein (TIGR01451 family)
MTIAKKIIGVTVASMTLASLCFGGEMNYSWKGYPSTAKTPSETKLLIERRVPKTVRPNEEYSYTVKITNRSHYKLDEIVLTEKLPPGFKFIRAVPGPTKYNKVRRELRWNFGFLMPQQKVIITITGKAIKPGEIVHRGNANLIFHLGQMNAIMEVVNPSILFTLEAKKNLIITETFPATMTFKNNGTATVLNAKLVKKTLDGLVHSNGEKGFTVPIGDLQPGDSKTFKVNLKAAKTGRFANNLVVRARDGVTAAAKLVSNITQPKLAFEGSAPEMRYKGNKIRYDFKVTNKGDGEARNLKVVLDIAGDVKFLSATEGGKSEKSSIVWKLGTLQPGDSKKLSANVLANKIEKVGATATVRAFAADPKTRSFLTDVQGIPALLLWVDDKMDPVPVGDNETYTINVKNQGSKSAHGVIVECQLEKSMKFVSASSNGVKGTIKGNKIVFPPMPSLPVGQTATWTVVVKALQGGDVRFKGSVKCSELPTSVTEAESTNFYE